MGHFEIRRIWNLEFRIWNVLKMPHEIGKMGHFEIRRIRIWNFRVWNFLKIPHENGKMGNFNQARHFDFQQVAFKYSENSVILKILIQTISPRKWKNGALGNSGNGNFEFASVGFSKMPHENGKMGHFETGGIGIWNLRVWNFLRCPMKKAKWGILKQEELEFIFLEFSFQKAPFPIEMAKWGIY